jgi:hypothetical protein
MRRRWWQSSRFRAKEVVRISEPCLRNIGPPHGYIGPSPPSVSGTTCGARARLRIFPDNSSALTFCGVMAPHVL